MIATVDGRTSTAVGDGNRNYDGDCFYIFGVRKKTSLSQFNLPSLS